MGLIRGKQKVLPSAHSSRETMLALGPSMRRRKAPRQCAGATRARKRCSITSESTARTESGSLACEALRCGGRFCAFHAEVFSVAPVVVQEPRLFFLDFESVESKSRPTTHALQKKEDRENLGGAGVHKLGTGHRAW